MLSCLRVYGVLMHFPPALDVTGRAKTLGISLPVVQKNGQNRLFVGKVLSDAKR